MTSASNLSSATPDAAVQDVVVSVCTLTLLAVGLWLCACVVVCLADALRCGAASPCRPGVLRPRAVQTLVATLVSAVAVGAGPAAGSDQAPVLPTVLHGLSTPDRTYGGVRTHSVEAGESLWSITADALAPDAGDEVVARTWPLLHRLNRDRIGDDPDLIHPGTLLRLPARAAVTHEGATR